MVDSGELKKLKVAELREMLKAKGLDATGVKAVLIERLVAAEDATVEKVADIIEEEDVEIEQERVDSQGASVVQSEPAPAVAAAAAANQGLDDALARRRQKWESGFATLRDEGIVKNGPDALLKSGGASSGSLERSKKFSAENLDIFRDMAVASNKKKKAPSEESSAPAGAASLTMQAKMDMPLGDIAAHSAKVRKQNKSGKKRRDGKGRHGGDRKRRVEGGNDDHEKVPKTAALGSGVSEELRAARARKFQSAV